MHLMDSLFPWDRLDDSPDLVVIEHFVRHVPDGRLLEALESARGTGRIWDGTGQGGATHLSARPGRLGQTRWSPIARALRANSS